MAQAFPGLQTSGLSTGSHGEIQEFWCHEKHPSLLSGDLALGGHPLNSAPTGGPGAQLSTLKASPSPLPQGGQ